MEGVQGVLGVLANAGFAPLPRPLRIVGTDFDFEAAARGTDTSHDLVLIATDRVPHRRLQRLVSGLARSLDVAGSRRPVSLVVLGGIEASDRSELERYARVLPIASSAPDTAEIEEAIAVLLPLHLPNADLTHGSDPVNEVMAVLGPSRATSDHIALIKVAADGADAVRERMRVYANTITGWTDESEENNA